MREDTFPALVWCPFPDGETAEIVAGLLIDEGLIACANMIGQIVSVFAWQGKRERTTETGVVLKTNSALLDRAIMRLAALHPYEEPAITGWVCDGAAPATISWLGALGR